MKDRARFLLYALIFVFFLSLVAGFFSAWAYEKKGLTLALTSLISVAVVAFLVLYNHEGLRNERDRERVLLKRVEDSWVSSLNEIERFAPGVSLIKLEYKPLDEPSNVKEPKSDEVELLRSVCRIPEPELTITRAFEKAKRSLLIRGPAGSGKTVSLLMLARHLVKRALRNPGQPVPVVLSLASWNDRDYRVFEDWLVDELKLKYNLAEEVSMNWLIDRRLLLILDGLDEVVEREACVDKLQMFLTDFQPPGVVVACRIDEKPLPELGHETRVLELSDESVRQYSAQAEMMFKNGNVPKLARSPLNLTLMLLVGKNELSSNATRDDLLRAFIDKQLDKTKRMRLSLDQIRKRLRWLAHGMDEHRQVIFYIEGLQPSWLPHQLVYTIASRIFATFCVMMLGYLIMKFCNNVLGYFLGVQKVSFGINFVTESPWMWLTITIVIGGLFMAGIDYRALTKSKNLSTKVRATLSERGNWLNLLRNVGACCGLFAFFGWLVFDWITAFGGAFLYGIAFGLVFWFRGTGRSSGIDIRTADKVRLTGVSVRGIFLGALTGTALGILPTILIWYRDNWGAAWRFSLLPPLIGLIVGGVTSGLDKVSVIEKTYPNQGVWLSFRNTVLIWLVVGFLASTAIWGYAMALVGQPSATLQDSIFLGATIGMLVGMGFGGLDVIYHIALRLILAFQGMVPLIKLREFLDNAAYLGFLRKVGGGYMFLHGSLRDQFKALGTVATKPLTPTTINVKDIAQSPASSATPQT